MQIRFEVNLNEVKPWEEPEPLQGGEYLARIVDHEERQGPEGPYDQWKLEILSEPYRYRHVPVRTSSRVNPIVS